MRLSVIALITFLFCSSSAFATTYTFNGNGYWVNPANWVGGQVGPNILGRTDTIIITGNCRVAAVFPFDPAGLDDVGPGTVTIAVGGNLSLGNDREFIVDGGHINVAGTLLNGTGFNYFSGNISVSGLLINSSAIYGSGPITVLSGGIFYNGGTTALPDYAICWPGSLTINSGGQFINTVRGTLMGNGNITGTVTNTGILAPGNSPGTYTINGDYNASAGSTHNFEVGGTTVGSYDRANVSGNVNLNGALNITLYNGYTPSGSYDLPIITGTIHGTFSSVSLPPSYSLIYTPNSVVLRLLAALPVRFLGLNLQPGTAGIDVSWKVDEAQRAGSYRIEWSMDGRQFAAVGQVAASGKTEYTFHDAHTSGFYRIREVDLDGSSQYSGIVRLDKGQGSVVFRAFPSPARSAITVQYPTAAPSSTIWINAANGLMVGQLTPAAGTQEATIQAGQWPAGLYFIRLKQGDRTIGVTTVTVVH